MSFAWLARLMCDLFSKQILAKGYDVSVGIAVRVSVGVWLCSRAFFFHS